ncbi:DUF6263 family protein [uncultured Chryseobacterium sp.]|uniref:DUF6263 family protein n=1 Tax=uncultured Chryseobacterium sp. TaxID=259322 RepID=UPI002631CCF6|nr:DUF6263 family protein [uncultured Chryseobacterium sp.]
MKKITALALLSIALVSCKKETQTVTKVDPKTGKTITVEVPVEDSAKTAAKVAANPAIKDSLGVYRQSFKLEKGKTYPLVTYQRDVQSITAPNGQSQSGTSESTDEMSFTVNNFDKGIYDITINLLGKRNSQTANGKTITIDTKQAAPADQNLKMMWTVNKALTGNKLQMKMQENGKVLSITGFEPIYTKVASSAGSLIKDATQKNAFLKSFKSSFSEATIKEQFSKNLMVLPATGAKIGQKWTESENATPDGKVKITTTYVLKSVANGIANVSVTGGIPYKSEKRSKEGVTHSLSSELSQSGNVQLDQNTGWIKHQNISVKTTQTESISDGKQTQSMKSSSTSTVMVNPSGK